MRIVSPLLKRVVYPGLSRTGYLRRLRGAMPVVLTYHGVYPRGYAPRDPVLDGNLVTAKSFVRQIQLLKSEYNLITPAEFRDWLSGNCDLPPRSVMLTCDDGLLNAFIEMLPLIRELGVVFLFFVTGASTGTQPGMLWHEQLYLWLLHSRSKISLQTPWRDTPYLAEDADNVRSLWIELVERLSTVHSGTRAQILASIGTQIGISENWESEYSQNEALRSRFFMLDRDQLRQLAEAGMTIGAHTVSHPMLSKMKEENVLAEISDSKTKLEQLFGQEIWAFAYPFGTSQAVGKRESTMARLAGFECAFMNLENGERDPFMFPRIHVTSAMGISEFEAHVSGFYSSIRGNRFHERRSIMA